jgi:hypothetical protein
LVINDKNGNDFFEGNEDYDIDSFQYTVLDVPNRRTPFKLLEIDSVTHFLVEPIFVSDIILDFGNGDTDTITVVCEPCLPSTEVFTNNLKYIYNGEVVQEYNFLNNRNLIVELIEKNCDRCISEPIVTVLTKGE